MFQFHLLTWQAFTQESRALFKLALPILMAQLALTGLGVVDTLMSGWAGVNDLAAIGLGSSIMLPVFIMGTGILLAITPIVSKAFGQKSQNLPEYLFQGLWVAVPVGIFSLLLLMNIEWLLNWLALNSELYQLVDDYLFYIAFGMPAIAFYQALRFYWEGLGKTLPTMWISLFALLLNIPLNALFIFGYGPVEAYGAAGCGIASALVMWIMLAIGFIYISTAKLAQQPIDWRRFSKPNWHSGFGSIVKIGSPNAMALLFEVSLFTFIALFIAPLGAVIIAGHQIAISVTSVLFMLPLSIGMAVTVRVSLAYGEKNAAQLMIVLRTAMLIAVITGLVLAILTLLFKENIVGWYSDNPEVSVIAIALLVFASLYQIVDTVQVTAAGCLRGFHDTQITMWVTLLSYWGIGLGIGYVLTFTDWIFPAMGVEGFWLGIVLGLTLASVLLSWRLITVYPKIIKGFADES